MSDIVSSSNDDLFQEGENAISDIAEIDAAPTGDKKVLKFLQHAENAIGSLAEIDPDNENMAAIATTETGTDNGVKSQAIRNQKGMTSSKTDEAATSIVNTKKVTQITAKVKSGITVVRSGGSEAYAKGPKAQITVILGEDTRSWFDKYCAIM